MSANNFNPYLGLKPFTINESEFHYGGESTAYDLISLIEENAISLLVGFSGSGKSSFINAKFIPILKGYKFKNSEKGWEVIRTQPENNPLENLLREVKKSDTGKRLTKSGIKKNTLLRDWFNHDRTNDKRGLIIIDQFEELITLCDQKIALEFIKSLQRLVKRNENISILLSGRVDYLYAIARFEGLSEMLTRSTLFIPKVKEDDLINSIRRPAFAFDKIIHDDLAEILLEESLALRNKSQKDESSFEEDDSLPLLQYFLMHLWNSFKRNKIFNTTHYKKIGPLDKVLGRHLDNIYFFSKGSNREEAKLTKFLFQYISKRDGQNPKRIVRNPKSIEKLIKLYNSIHKPKSNKRKWTRIIKRYTAPEVAAIRIKDENELEVIHESVFRQWQRCYKWVEEKYVRFEKFEKLLKSKGDNLDNKSVKDFLNEEHYFNSEEWLKEYFNESDNIQDKDFFTFKNNTEELIQRLHRLRFVHAIKNANFSEIGKILKHNEEIENGFKEGQLILLKDKELYSKELDGKESDGKEFYYALYPQQLKKTENKIENKFNSEAEENNSNSFGLPSPSKEIHINRWSRKLNSSPNFQEKLRKIKRSDSDELTHDYYLFHFAAFAGQEEYLNALYQFCYKKDSDPGIYSIPSEKVNSGKKVFSKSTTAFDSALFGGQLKLLNNIYKKYNFNEQKHALIKPAVSSQKTPMHTAVMLNHQDIINWLVQKNNKVNKKSNLFENTDKLSDIPLHQGTFFNYDEINAKLLTKEQVLWKNNSKLTPFNYACWLKSDKTIEHLIDFAAKKDILDDMLEITPPNELYPTNYLYLAIDNVPEAFDQTLNKKSFYVLNKLLNHEIVGQRSCEQINIPYWKEWTLLHFAIENSPFEIIKLLLEKGANPNLKRSNGNSSVDDAVNHADINILKLLLKNTLVNIDQEIKNKAAQKAFNTSKFYHYNLLLQNGAHHYIPFSFDEYYNDIKFEKVKTTKDEFERKIDQEFQTSDTSWPIRPLINSEWYNLDITQSKNVLKQIYNLKSTFKEKPLFKEVRICPLPFYSKSRLIEVNCSFQNNKTGYLTFIESHNKGNQVLTWLNGTSPPIHELNRLLPIQLNDENIFDYLKFFCSTVHGEEGAFNIIESPNEILWLTKKEEKFAGGFIQFIIDTYCNPPFPKLENDLKVWYSYTLINYSNAIFLANFKIEPSGMVHMMNDMPFVAGISLTQEVYEHGLRTDKTLRPPKGESIEIPTFIYAAKNNLPAVMKWLYNRNNYLNVNEKTTPSDHTEFDNEVSNKKIITGKTALRLIVERKDIKTLKWLLSIKGIKDLKAKDRKNALDIAYEMKAKQSITLLEKHFKKPKSKK